MRFRTLLASGDEAGLCAAAEAEFGVTLPADAAAWLCREFRAVVGRGWHADSTDAYWRTRVKVFLINAGRFPHGCRCVDYEGWASATLHVFFVSVEETPEQLARLPEGGESPPTLATPGIARRRSSVLGPIDATAASGLGG